MKPFDPWTLEPWNLWDHWAPFTRWHPRNIDTTATGSGSPSTFDTWRPRTLQLFKELWHIRSLKLWTSQGRLWRPLTFENCYDLQLIRPMKPWTSQGTLEPLLPLTPTGSMTLKVDHPCRFLGAGWDLPYSFTDIVSRTTWQRLNYTEVVFQVLF